MTGLRVEKRSYSHGAWRVLTEEGEQVYQEIPYPHANPPSVTAENTPAWQRFPKTISHPVCFQTKREALAWIKAHR